MLKTSNAFASTPNTDAELEICSGVYPKVPYNSAMSMEVQERILRAAKYIMHSMLTYMSKFPFTLETEVFYTANITSDKFFFLHPLTTEVTTLGIASSEKVFDGNHDLNVFCMYLNIGHTSVWLNKPVIEVDSTHWETINKQGIGTHLISVIENACAKFDLSTELLIADRSMTLTDGNAGDTPWVRIMAKFPNMSYIEL